MSPCRYGQVTLSIHPQTHTEEMHSWFPIYFPLKEPIHCPAGAAIKAHMWRCSANHKVGRQTHHGALEQSIKPCKGALYLFTSYAVLHACWHFLIFCMQRWATVFRGENSHGTCVTPNPRSGKHRYSK